MYAGGYGWCFWIFWKVKDNCWGIYIPLVHRLRRRCVLKKSLLLSPLAVLIPSLDGICGIQESDDIFSRHPLTGGWAAALKNSELKTVSTWTWIEEPGDTWEQGRRPAPFEAFRAVELLTLWLTSYPFKAGNIIHLLHSKENSARVLRAVQTDLVRDVNFIFKSLVVHERDLGNEMNLTKPNHRSGGFEARPESRSTGELSTLRWGCSTRLWLERGSRSGTRSRRPNLYCHWC